MSLQLDAIVDLLLISVIARRVMAGLAVAALVVCGVAIVCAP
jgi:hypothetical protein